MATGVTEASHVRDIDMIESQLKGKTLLVYWYLLQQPSKTVGIRSVQRNLGFSSPSIAVHHLEKLSDLGLVEKKSTGEYILKEEVKVGILKFFTHIGRIIIPRYFFYSVFFSTMLVSYLVLAFIERVGINFYALLFVIAAITILWVETVKLWRAKPF